jgi:hypothetical protein
MLLLLLSLLFVLGFCVVRPKDPATLLVGISLDEMNFFGSHKGMCKDIPPNGEPNKCPFIGSYISKWWDLH